MNGKCSNLTRRQSSNPRFQAQNTKTLYLLKTEGMPVNDVLIGHTELFIVSVICDFVAVVFLILFVKLCLFDLKYFLI